MRVPCPFALKHKQTSNVLLYIKNIYVKRQHNKIVHSSWYKIKFCIRSLLAYFWWFSWYTFIIATRNIFILCLTFFFTVNHNQGSLNPCNIYLKYHGWSFVFFSKKTWCWSSRKCSSIIHFRSFYERFQQINFYI